MIAVGDTVVAKPGTLWCSRDVGGRPLRVVHVEPYPASVGGPVYVCEHSNGPHLQVDQLADTPADVPPPAGHRP